MKTPQKLKNPNKYIFLTIMMHKFFQNDNHFVLVIIIILEGSKEAVVVQLPPLYCHSATYWNTA